KPQAVSDKIYLTEYPSYYDTNTDSLHLLGFCSPYVVDHDSASDCFFVYEEITNTILCYYDTVVKSSFTLPNYMTKALFYPESTTSLSSLRSKNDIKIYPIPAKEKLIIEIPDQGGKLRIYNASGSLLISKQFISEAEKSEINISELTTGLYFIEIESLYKNYSGRFLKVE
ncbi:MAG: T9SS type A sorting domain-containing protein, partial [Bacteroidales bacterium]|nr:T9SS type A sorting domain-containing protein [Bacteroidales bacterium]